VKKRFISKSWSKWCGSSAIALITGLGATFLAMTPSADLPPPPEDGHRALRDNPVETSPDPEPTTAFTGYPDAPAFSIVSRQDDLSHYPCANCHANMPANTERRKLNAPHPAALDHGDGRMWCFDCHNEEERNKLATASGERVGFDYGDQVCSQCHYAVHRDWTFGVHGKRKARWQGERTSYSCAHCHNPHDPAVRPREPEQPPGVRAGLEPMPDKHVEHPRIYPWQPAHEEDDDDRNSE